MLTGFLLVSCVLVVLFFFGPRVKIDTVIRPMELPVDLDRYLAESEARFSDIRVGAEKTIIWAGEKGEKTALSVVYLHGFAACRQEAAPLAEIVAQELGANLFYTRFTGHGRSSEAMVDGSVNNWLNDAWEAVEIGRKIGEQVVVIGLSTGGTMATWLATESIAEHVCAFILLSPNLSLVDRRTELLTLPWGRQIAELVMGPEYSWEPHNEEYEKFWTNRFPTQALLPLQGMVRIARSLDLGTIRTPLLVIYSPADEVVCPVTIEKRFGSIGSEKKKLIPYYESGSPSHHVLAGDILAPGSTRPIADMIVDFIKN
ncbi:carboxylesterase [Desulfopila sp. IMCC35008]|uniref:alpha/beta hydrolase n=1 Tax=Desulfopila sp. IMCC35008 TaxID=2653858 RepID=UPI0013D0BAF5|nr:alpha/beta fold hydrolase [Desulfopila sp. IMCC35008]